MLFLVEKEWRTKGGNRGGNGAHENEEYEVKSKDYLESETSRFRKEWKRSEIRRKERKEKRRRERRREENR